VFAFKRRVLFGAAADCEDQQQQQQQDSAAALPLLGCERRVEVVADASKPKGGWHNLHLDMFHTL
jgi:hypothetical protein